MARRNNKKNLIKGANYLLYLFIGFSIGYGAQYLPQNSAHDSAPIAMDRSSPMIRFSPTKKRDEQQGCTRLIVDTIKKTQSTIHIGIFSLTSKPITAALEAACQRGVKVAIIVDKKFSTKDSIKALTKAGVQVYIYKGKHTYHHKFLISDKKIVITGSFNYSKQAEATNRENCCYTPNQELAEVYHKKWQEQLKSPNIHHYNKLHALPS